MVRQITVIVPDRPGMLARVSGLLGEAGIQVIGFMVEGASEFSILRLVCDRTDEAREVLAVAGYDVQESQVLALAVEDEPGGLARVMGRLASADLNVGYGYSASVAGRVIDIVQVSGEPVAVKLAQAGVRGLGEEELAASR